MLHKVKIVLVLAVALVVVLPVQAQDGGGLTDEQVLTLARVATAMDAVLTYDYMVVDTYETMYVAMELTQGAQVVTQEETVELQKTVRHIQGDVVNRHGMFQAHVDAIDFDGNAYTITLNAEGRQVDGVFYLQVEQDVLAGTPEPVLDGWVVVQTGDDFAALDHLNLGEFIDDPDDPDIFEYLDALFEFATGVTVEPGALDDGTPYEVVSVWFEGADFLAAMNALTAVAFAPDSLPAVLYTQMDAESTLLIQVALMADDIVLSRAGEANFVWTGLDLSLIAPEVPPGIATVSTTSAFTIESVIYDVGVPFEPVAVPEM